MMAYTPKDGDKPVADIKPGGLTEEAVKRLSRRPDILKRMQVFDDMWGLDCYDPFSDDACSSAVSQLVKCAIIDAAAIIEDNE